MKTPGQSPNMKQPGPSKRWLAVGLALLSIVAVVLAITYYAGRNPQTSGVSEANKKLSADTDRRVDIDAVDEQLQYWFGKHREYPTFEQISDDAWVQQNLRGISVEALRTPGATANSMQRTSTPDKDHYGYQTFDASGAPCQGGNCTSFKLFWFSEFDSTVHTKGSAN